MEHGQENITVVDENGNEQLCNVLFTFESDEFEKSYVLYYPVGADEDEDEEIEIHASSFTPNEDGNDGELTSNRNRCRMGSNRRNVKYILRRRRGRRRRIIRLSPK